jgi:dihydrofolate synthase/folylpolyglutamate synthase
MNLDRWLALLEQRHPRAIDLGLERCGAVYRRLGSPRPARQVFTVAGTNGKGSTVAYLAALCAAAGQRYGTYTSPHILHFNERITVMGVPVSDSCLVAAFERVEIARESESLTYFEFTTLAGLLILNESGLEYAVLEVGLGGRLDTVNLVDADCVVITPIGLDHQDFLGPDLDSIAKEKAGVIRAGRPVVCTENQPPAPILQISAQMAAPVFRRGIEFDLARQPDQGGTLLFSMGGRSMLISPPAMGGAHQRDNLAAALCAFSILNPGCFSQAPELSDAIQQVKVPGRLQTIAGMAGCRPEIILDVGHNAMAARVVADFLVRSERSSVTCVLAMLGDKPVEDVAVTLGEVCNRWYCASSPGARGQTAGVLSDRLQKALPGADITEVEDLGDALQIALENTDSRDTILVFGSFTTVAAALGWIKNSLQHDRHDTARIIPPGPEAGQ